MSPKKFLPFQLLYFLVIQNIFVKPLQLHLSGLVIQITKALGEVFLIPSATCFIIFKFIPNKSSLVIPGFLGTPAVIIITSEFFVSS